MRNNKIHIGEIHTFAGEFPTVPTYEHVDAEMLYEGDETPFHITLAIAESGRTSANGLIYDKELVSRIENQLSGSGGIRGHLSDAELETAYPVDAVNWIGALRVGEKLWAKGYVPPGETREDLRRKKATGGQIGTSIFGTCHVEEAEDQQWRAVEFEMESLDLVPAKRASLKMGGEFAVTRESKQQQVEEGNMPDVTKKDVIAELTVGDIPKVIREQIIKDAQVKADAGRVSELESQIAELQGETGRVAELEKQVTELRQYANIVAEVRAFLGAEVDVVETVQKMHETLSTLTGILGADVNIEVRVTEMHEHIAEMKKQAFEGAIDKKVAEFVDWSVSDDRSKERLAAFRRNMRRAVLAELGDNRDEKHLTEVARKLWDEEYQVLAEGLRDGLAGPPALVGGQNGGGQGEWDNYKTEEGQESLRARYGVN